MNQVISCSCGEVIVKSLDDDTKVRNVKIVVFRDGGAFGVCKSCNKEVSIPLRLDTELLKSMCVAPPRATSAPRLYIRNMK